MTRPTTATPSTVPPETILDAGADLPGLLGVRPCAEPVAEPCFRAVVDGVRRILEASEGRDAA